MTYQKRQTYGDNKKDQRLPGLEEWGGDELAEHRGIVRQCKILCDAIMMDPCNYGIFQNP